MRHSLLAGIALLALSAPSLAQDNDVNKDDIPVFREGQIISTQKPAEAAPKPQDKAARSARDLLLDLPNLQALSQAGSSANHEAWTAYENQDYVQARLLAARAGANGDAGSQLLMGIMLDHGMGGDPDPVNAVNWYKKAGKMEVAEAWLALAGMAFDNRGGLTATDGRGFLHQAAELGNVDAMLALGKAYSSGMGGPIDDDQASKWYENAILKGANKARVELADLKLANGDEDGALQLYRTAMFGGSADAAWKAGVLLADPSSEHHDRAQAGEYLKTAAEAGIPAAMTDYGTWFATGYPPLDAQAARWFRKAAHANDPEGQYLFAIALSKGQGVMQDREAAYEWALRAHAQDKANQDYENLELALEKGMPPSTRDMIFAQSKMPLTVSKVSVADADKAAAAEAKQVAAEKAEEAEQRKKAQAEADKSRADNGKAVAEAMEKEAPQSGAPK